jgi:hypothetical protein
MTAARLRIDHRVVIAPKPNRPQGPAAAERYGWASFVSAR